MLLKTVGGITISKDNDKAKSDIERHVETVRTEADKRDVSVLISLIIRLSESINSRYLKSQTGTNMKELKALQNIGYVAQSKKLVIMLQKAKDNNSMKAIHIHDVRYINECLKKLCFKPEAVDTTYPEMETLEREALIAEARENLEKARENAGKDIAFTYLKLVIDTATKEDTSFERIYFEDIGTDLKEIDQLQRI
ncbi:MAG: hypothetical protein KAI71_05695 [Candidatus Pacebacteria bacterium]|nr:hypothetical protein [Candidatus Paceibacterota bacterium]